MIPHRPSKRPSFTTNLPIGYTGIYILSVEVLLPMTVACGKLTTIKEYRQEKNSNLRKKITLVWKIVIVSPYRRSYTKYFHSFRADHNVNESFQKSSVCFYVVIRIRTWLAHFRLSALLQIVILYSGTHSFRKVLCLFPEESKVW